MLNAIRDQIDLQHESDMASLQILAGQISEARALLDRISHLDTEGVDHDLDNAAYSIERCIENAGVGYAQRMGGDMTMDAETRKERFGETGEVVWRLDE